MSTYKLLVITTGGTIAQEHDQVTGQGVSTEEGEKQKSKQFANMLQNIANHEGYDMHIESINILNKDSSNIIPADWTAMIKAVGENYDDYDSLLITHGTNTLGYTSAALSFALGKLGKKLILTGSQVPFGYAGSDAVLNLENAIRVAYLERELAGVIAVFGSHIITGVRAKKTTEFEYDAFKTFSAKASLGRIGRVLKMNEDAVRDHNKWIEPRARVSKELDVKANFEKFDKIACLTEFPGMSSKIFESLVDKCGIEGFILRASGAGDPNVANKEDTYPNLRAGFEFLQAKGIPIVVTTQAPDGVATMDVNNPGMIAYELGAIPAWDMSIEAMTVKLAWLLGRKFPYDEMRTLMNQPFRGEIAEIRR